GQGPDPVDQLGVVGQLVDAGDRPGQVGVGALAAGPHHTDVDAFAGALGGDPNLVDDGTQQRLAVGVGGGGRVPDRRDVLGEGADLGQLGGGQPGRAGVLVPLVLVDQARLFGQGLLPVAFQLPHDEPVLRLGLLVATPRPV